MTPRPFCLTVAFLILFATTVSAQSFRTGDLPIHDKTENSTATLNFAKAPNTSQQQTDEDAYRVWYATNAEKNVPKALELAKTYLKDFPSGKHADYLKGWLANTRSKLFTEAVNAKKFDEMIRLGNEALAEQPEDLNYLIALADNLNVNESSAKPANFSHAADAATFSRRAIELIEAGKQPADSPQWNKNQSLAYLYQILGTIEEHNKNADKALENYVKAGTLDPTSVFSFFSSGRLYQAKYLAAAEKYQAIPEADRDAATPTPQVTAVRKEVNDAADATIDRWVKFLKLTATNNTYGAARDEVEKAVAELYKYRHPDSPDGYLQLIKP